MQVKAVVFKHPPGETSLASVSSGTSLGLVWYASLIWAGLVCQQQFGQFATVYLGRCGVPVVGRM